MICLAIIVDKKESVRDESSDKCSDRQTEDKKIKEYLQRSDTAVIFAEPVELVQTKTEFIENNNNEKDGQKDGQSVKIKVEDNDKNVVNTNENRIPESHSSNQSKSDFCLIL